MKTVFITGVGRGIGKALAQKFLAEEFFVIGTTQEGTADFSNERLKIIQLDLTSSASVSACAEAARRLDKKIDIHINNAGAIFDEEETGVIVEKLRRTLEVNLIGTIDLTEQILPLLNADAHIVNISSKAGSLSVGQSSSHEPGMYPCYRISKAALNMYTSVLAYKLKSSGITVSSVHPGWVRTDMGGEEAPMSPEEAAEWIFKLAISRPETGGFWFKCERLPW